MTRDGNRKRKRVPTILWRLFGDRARPLAETILALVTAAECRCGGRRCLACIGDETMSYLVRSGDPSDYQKLLTGCFVVVSENAPVLGVFDAQCRLPLREIVRGSIEALMREKSPSSNLICCRYNEDICSSAVFDELTSPKWKSLLRRVGDALMVYLLKYTSLFLPLPRRKYNQIAGYPISDLCFKLSRRIPDSKSQHDAPVCNGSWKKRKMVEEDIESIPGKQLSTHTLGFEPSSDTIKFVANNVSICGPSEKLSREKCEGSSKTDAVSSKKRTRHYRWQRQRKRRQLIVQENCPLTSCGGNNCTNDNFPRQLENDHFASSSQRGESNISHCLCCSVFKNIQKMNKNAEIGRRNIFYKLENSTRMLPKKHMLYALKPHGKGASDLFKDIFGVLDIDTNPGTMLCSHSKNGHLVTPPCLYHSLIKQLKSLIRKTQYCGHLRLLDKHCPIRSLCQDASSTAGDAFEGNDFETNLSTGGQDGAQIDKKLFIISKEKHCKMVSETSIDQVEPSKLYCPKKQVVSFIWAICRRIVPSTLLGEPSNWRILTKTISKFIQLRKFEKFSLKECIYKLKISKFPLLSNKQHGYNNRGCGEHGIADIARHAILECWVFWFFTRLVSPLVEANFYVTESEHERQEVIYYRKSTWEKLMKDAECVKDGRFRLLSCASAKKIMEKRSFGFSRARLRPKQTGFRLLANLRAPSKMLMSPSPSRIHSNYQLQRKSFGCHQRKYRFFKSVNSILNDLHVVLKGLFTKERKKMGSSVFDYNDVYRKLVPFLFLLKNRSTNMPSVFIVVSDVSKAFDSINQDKLLSVMKDVVLEDEYTLEKLAQVIRTGKSLKVHQHQILVNQDVVTPSAKITSWLPGQSSDGIFVKKAFSRKIRKEEIKFLLKEHVTRNVVQFDNNFYLQLVGIPQGSVLSTSLCSLYYEHMERSVVVPFLQKAGKVLLGQYDIHGASVSSDIHTTEAVPCGAEYLLLRFIDDFLFISTSKKQASMFFSRLERGVRDYNCYMNQEKYGLNFDMDNRRGCQSNRIHVGEDGVSFLQWSGLLINCSTLEIQADYTRYLNIHLRSTLTVSRQGTVARQVREKLRSYLRPKCHPIFYDSNINSPGVVRLNIYQAFLVCAMKFVCHVSQLSVLPKFSPKFYMNAIAASLRYMDRLIKMKMYSFVIDNVFRPKYDVKRKEIIWLGLYAFSRVLKKKQSQHKKLLQLLMVSRLKAYKMIDKMSSDLKFAVDDAHSSVLWKIKY